MSKYGVLSGPHFLAFSLNARKHGPEKTPYLDTLQCFLNAISYFEVLAFVLFTKVLTLWRLCREDNFQSFRMHIIGLVSISVKPAEYQYGCKYKQGPNSCKSRSVFYEL